MASRTPAWKIRALMEAEEDIIYVEDAGHKVERFTDWHWRIDGIDFYPSTLKYMKNKVVTEYKSLLDHFNLK